MPNTDDIQYLNNDNGEGCTQAKLYDGRGQHQLTWDYNYKEFGNSTGAKNHVAFLQAIVI